MTDSLPGVRSVVTSGRSEFGICDLGLLTSSLGVPSLELRDLHSRGSEYLLQVRFPVPFRPRAAAIEIKCRDAMFRVSVTGEVRFGKSDHAGHAAFTGEFVPDRIDDFEAEVVDDAGKSRL